LQSNVPQHQVMFRLQQTATHRNPEGHETLFQLIWGK
jgi:hypothetical protein